MANKFSIGIDIGGTSMKAVLFDGEKILADYILATPKDNLEHFIIMLTALINPLLEKAHKEKIKIQGVGFALPGVINYKERKVLKSPNIPIIDNVNIVEQLENKINLPIQIDNDTNCFLKAEIMFGAGKNYNNVYGVIIGTGIGGAWWINNKIYNGSHNGAGEPGRMIINFTEPIELEKAYQKLSQNNLKNLSIEAYRGDELAKKSFQEIGKYLGIAFANIVNLIDPELIIIGGNVIEVSDLFLSNIKKEMSEYIMNPESKKIKILKSKLGQNSGAVGAALLMNNE